MIVHEWAKNWGCPGPALPRFRVLFTKTTQSARDRSANSNIVRLCIVCVRLVIRHPTPLARSILKKNNNKKKEPFLFW